MFTIQTTLKRLKLDSSLTDMAYMSVICLYFVASFQTLELANNNIRSMDGLQGHKYLEVIDLEENEVGETICHMSLTLL